MGATEDAITSVERCTRKGRTVAEETAAAAGVDQDNVTRWLAERVDQLDPPLQFERPSVGRSNLTYVVTDAAGRRWVLRRPPLSGRLPSAHDMGREFRIITALGASGYRVPSTIGFCADETITGAEFYVTDYVDGFTVELAEDAERYLPLEAREPVSMQLMDTLAELHEFDVHDVGLGDLGRHDGYIERQLRRWHLQWQSAKTRELPSAEEAHEILAATVPAAQRVSVVHGDYRIDNVRVDAEGNVLAVLDWELCTLGDPLADLGTVLSAWQEPDDPPAPFQPSPSRVAGFPGRAALIDRYAQSSGLDVERVDFYIAFSTWKLAMIMEGVYTRYAGGAYGEVDPATEQLFAAQAISLAGAALEKLRDSR
jgi:aminoglycoside phosphotransferase (APT) family kinase protein